MLRIAICDDDHEVIRQTEFILDQNKLYIREYESFLGSMDLLTYLDRSKSRFDLYLLDIELPGMNGIELAKNIRRHDFSAFIVFQTSYREYMEEAFELTTFQYLLKPVVAERLKAVVIKASRYLSVVKRRFQFVSKKEFVSVLCNEILYFEKNKRKVIIHTGTSIYETYMTSAEIMEQLNPDVFFSICHSYIVNMEYIKTIRKNEVILYNDVVLHFSREKRKDILSKMKLSLEVK